MPGINDITCQHRFAVSRIAMRIQAKVLFRRRKPHPVTRVGAAFWANKFCINKSTWKVSSGFIRCHRQQNIISGNKFPTKEATLKENLYAQSSVRQIFSWIANPLLDLPRHSKKISRSKDCDYNGLYLHPSNLVGLALACYRPPCHFTLVYSL